MRDEGGDACCNGGQHVQSDGEEEEDKVFVVPVPETVVDVDAVVIKLFDTLRADHAVESPRRLDDLAVEAKVLEVNVPIISNLKQVYNVQLLLHVPWIHAITDQVEDCR